MIYISYICGFLILGLVFSLYRGIKLSQDKKTLINKILQAPLQQPNSGLNGFVKNGDVRISYEIKESDFSNGQTYILINGHGQTRNMWPEAFISGLLTAGFKVITHDNRGVGDSHWMNQWSKKQSYSLEDMASDTLSVLKTLDVNKAHIIGQSMGGMIAQAIAIQDPKRILSLGLFMTSGFYYDAKLPQISKALLIKIIGRSVLYGRRLRTLTEKVIFQVSIQDLLSGDIAAYDEPFINKCMHEIHNRNGFNPKAGRQHTQAIINSGSRYDSLKNIIQPVLIVHGVSDPLIHISHAYKLAELIPQAKRLFLNGMGHELPEKYIPDILNAILNLASETNKTNQNQILINTQKL